MKFNREYWLDWKGWERAFLLSSVPALLGTGFFTGICLLFRFDISNSQVLFAGAIGMVSLGVVQQIKRKLEKHYH